MVSWAPLAGQVVAGVAGVTRQPSASATVALEVHNYEKEPMEAQVSVRIHGLDVKRDVDLGVLHLAAGETRMVGWKIGTSPIAPVGSLLRVIPHARYIRHGVTASIPGPILFAAFSADGQETLTSTKDGNEVRAYSLASDTAQRRGPASQAASSTDPTVALQRRRGKLDGVAVDSFTTPPPVGSDVIGDSLSASNVALTLLRDVGREGSVRAAAVM